MVSVEWDGQRVRNKFSPTAMLWRGAKMQTAFESMTRQLHCLQQMETGVWSSGDSLFVFKEKYTILS